MKWNKDKINSFLLDNNYGINISKEEILWSSQGVGKIAYHDSNKICIDYIEKKYHFKAQLGLRKLLSEEKIPFKETNLREAINGLMEKRQKLETSVRRYTDLIDEGNLLLG